MPGAVIFMYRTLVFLLCAVISAQAADVPRKLAFARAGTLYVANLDGSGVKKIATGAWPEISPDGSRVAYNTEDPSGKTPDRSSPSPTLPPENRR